MLESVLWLRPFSNLSGATYNATIEPTWNVNGNPPEKGA